MDERKLRGDSESEDITCAKARALYVDLIRKIPGTSSSEDDNAFKESRGWFEKYKKRTGIHNVVRHGEAASSDKAALFQRCFEVTKNTNLTLREFWKDHFNILNCLNLIDKAWEEVTVIYLFTLFVNNLLKSTLILNKIRFFFYFFFFISIFWGLGMNLFNF